MIFRKPYAFLIKHFRLIHLIISAILVYLVSYSNNIYKYINLCIDDAVNRYNALQYINYNIYIYMIIGLLLFGIIYWLFKYKDKPRNVYVISIGGYILVGIFLAILFNYFGKLPNNIIEQKEIRAYRDILLIFLGFQYIVIIIMVIRGFGFDIKKFNFTKDSKELDLNHEDGEEVEVDVNINTTNIIRGIRKQRRELGYFFQEYKIFILVIVGVLLFIGIFTGYNYFSKKFKIYNENEAIGYNNYIVIKDSYYNIDVNSNYIIVKFDAAKNGVEEKLNINNFILIINGTEYMPNKNICYNFDRLGNCYKKQYITSELRSYIMVYEVDVLNIERTYLLYKESYENSYKVKLDLENYD